MSTEFLKCLARCALVGSLVSACVAAADETVRPFGIPSRVPLTTSKITGSPNPPSPYQTELAFPHLSFENPVVLTNAPGSKRLFVAELNGKILSFANSAEIRSPDLVVDLKREMPDVDRIYGFTFDPKFPARPSCYVCYTAGQDLDDGTHVSRFEVILSDPPRIDAATEQPIIRWRSGGHNGGCLKFGVDGYLYVSTGDGGPAFPPDPLNSGQDVSTLLSAILRIDVEHPQAETNYSIPRDNPFVDLAGARPEIWAYGFRNPWKMSVDHQNGDLWVGDVGWELWEMVYRVERAANYGWSLVEGPQPVHRERERGPTAITPPTVAHSHVESRSITGGLVYRGSRLPELAGAYVYGDYVTGKLWAVRHDGHRAAAPQELVDTSIPIICFGEDNAGELYIVGYDGHVHRLIASPPGRQNLDFPKRLSDTGLFQSVAGHVLADGVIPYSVNAEPWMDGASAQRFLALPGTTTLGIHDQGNLQVGIVKGAWEFPTDAVLMKTISLEMEVGNPDTLQHLETQILHYDVDTWRGYNYVWNDAQTDAELAEAGSDRTLTIVDQSVPGGRRQQSWHFASRTECILCHTTRGGTIYGFNPAQLNRDHDYGKVADNQLRTLRHLDVFRELADSPAERLTNPYDTDADLADRARAYLHVNCAHCHRRGGGGTAAIDVQYQLSLAKTNLLESRPTQGTFGIHRAQVFAAGDPYRSVLYYRMSKLGRGRMPYLGSQEVDVRGLRLIHDWIRGVSGSDDPATNAHDSKSVGELDSHQLEELLSTTSGALRVLSALDAGKLSESTVKQVIATGVAHPDIQVHDLFERFVPAEKRTQRLGTTVDPQAILQIAGDASRGGELFASAAGVQCRNCHQLNKIGKSLGPDLARPATKRTRAQLLESILEPSKDIDPRYVAHLVETRDGRVVVGLLTSRDADKLVLADAQGNVATIAVADAELIAPQQKSLMPELLVQDMTAQEVADMLAFLIEQQDGR